MYNGHKDWNHWNVSLWINNDEGLYDMARRAVRRHNTKIGAAVALLEELEFLGITHTPDGAPYSTTSIRAALVDMCGDDMIDVPNIDVMEQAELAEFHRTLKALTRYVEARYKANKYRLERRIEDALRMDRLCESFYRDLPSCARW
ncbi:hypothetical protein KZJ38_07355 [Paraburkholderia edwinii]|uniref:Uncharacterized protein n=1 Tax=Paraburkholderia edwinii TaxID=2861782 RepID=A0ABX8UP83_9BURK|nr:hypothetical protein [Paraburkholderia edwinii]QYD70117.1 hypothetical protein KZJ38_07355 [Paraburkholderia edwinii]